MLILDVNYAKNDNHLGSSWNIKRSNKWGLVTPLEHSPHRYSTPHSGIDRCI